MTSTSKSMSFPYSEDPACYSVGLKIANNIPSAGTAPYSISPALPAGLSISSTTGIISGTPIATSPSTTYTVSDSHGSDTLTIKVGNANLAAIRKNSEYNQKQKCIQQKAKLNLPCLCTTDFCEGTVQ